MTDYTSQNSKLEPLEAIENPYSKREDHLHMGNFSPEPIIISYSEIFKWQTCRRQYYYRFIKGLSPVEESDAISTGNKGHRLLQNFYELLSAGRDKTTALELVTESAKKLANAEGLPDFNLIKAWTLVTNYIRDTDFTSNAIIIENRFLFPASILTDDGIFENVQIGFTPDVVFERTGGKIDIEDAKFVGREWSKSKKNRFPQAKLYQVFMEHMGYEISRSVVRFFNTTTAKISVQNYTMGETEKDTLVHDFLEGARELIAYKRAISYRDRASRTMNYTACQYCPFEFPCSLEAEGKDASKTFNSLYVTSNYDYTR